MKVIPAKQLQRNAGQVIIDIQHEPLEVERYGEKVGVFMSHRHFIQLRDAVIDKYWGEKALKAEKEGYLDKDTSEDFINDLLNVAA